MNKDELYQVAINCAHHITDECVILRYDPRKPGHNALNQLGRRLDEALADRLSEAVMERDGFKSDAITFRQERDEYQVGIAKQVEHTIVVQRKLDALTAYAGELEALLKRIYGWDVMDSPHGDGAYWRHEISTALSIPSVTNPSGETSGPVANSDCLREKASDKRVEGPHESPREPDPFDCQEFHELCMDYRGAHGFHAQPAYERLQEYCRRQAFWTGEKSLPGVGNAERSWWQCKCGGQIANCLDVCCFCSRERAASEVLVELPQSKETP